MPHYKDLNGGFHFLDSDTFQHLLPAGCAAVSDAEVAAKRLADHAAQALLDQSDATKDAKASVLSDEIKALLFFVADNLPTPIPHATARQQYKAILKGLL